MIKRRFDNNNYEFNSSSKKGVYLLHGFSSTTYEVRELAKFLSGHGYHTVANNLPGHGTTVEDCNKIKYDDWLYFIKEDIAKLASTSDKIYVVGCSMGAVLTLYAASIFPLNACVVGSTVLKFNNPLTINYIIPFLCRILKVQNKDQHNDNAAYNTRYYGYDAYPLIALNEMRKLNNLVLKKLKKVQCPSLVIHSRSDRLALKENFNLVSENIQSKTIKKLLVNHAHHNLFDSNPDQTIIFNNILAFLNQH